ncbi:phage holin family protein [Azospira inquinata]|uniref:Phage holin family protein n=1 Tax=Azospira inquinata TaxID=2785627 RepID=A0A975SPT6_9RHOO|nr:phage holin family protein [Azospira inquinata]QWT47142.1 phage holin family protein [Azospira inquinata]QWT50228.1 phage holin family protein [Azospira inquinata]
MPEQNPGREGFFKSLKNLLATLVAMGRTRLELLATEFEEEKLRIANLLILAVGAMVFLGIGIVLLVALLAAAFWESRIVVFAVASLIFFGGGIGLGLGFFRLSRRPSNLFSASLDELRRDIEALKREQQP